MHIHICLIQVPNNTFLFQPNLKKMKSVNKAAKMLKNYEKKF